MLDFETSNSKSNSWKITFFSKTIVTSEGAVSHNFFYYQQLSIARYQVSFYASNYFELLPIVSSAFKDVCTALILSVYNLYKIQSAVVTTDIFLLMNLTVGPYSVQISHHVQISSYGKTDVKNGGDKSQWTFKISSSTAQQPVLINVLIPRYQCNFFARILRDKSSIKFILH